ncbi:hypothetical protein [Catenulispora rubra]|uniref:hypothetical protein n=1 Tax=Catenulispora rubra TaxID=280293 RepID=UPI001892515D|nr:hypothetical protein [Catenulispora rubra]
MNSWINLNALWKIVVIGLLAGAGLPALFAVGLRALAPRGGAAGSAGTAGTAGTAEAQPDLLGKVAAGICFLAVLAAMGWGVYSIVHNS